MRKYSVLFPSVFCVVILVLILGGAGQNAQPAQNSVPLGTVVAFAGPHNQIPDGWMLCDGSALSRSAFNELFRAIGTAHGGGSPSYDEPKGDFNLPDYRGRFLRGVDDPDGPGSRTPANRDPDAKKRTHMITGSEVGGLVGSVQSDATAMPKGGFEIGLGGSHNHTLKTAKSNGTGASNPFGWGDGGSGHPETTSQTPDHHHALRGGDKESRPKMLMSTT